MSVLGAANEVVQHSTSTRPAKSSIEGKGDEQEHKTRKHSVIMLAMRF